MNKIAAIGAIIFLVCGIDCFSFPSPLVKRKVSAKTSTPSFVTSEKLRIGRFVLNNDENRELETPPVEIAPPVEVKVSLEEKMQKWEASEEELKNASLGGVVPGLVAGGTGADGFDIGLYVAFPIIVLTSLAFAFFPFIMDKIDVTSVGPPPTV